MDRSMCTFEKNGPADLKYNNFLDKQSVQSKISGRVDKLRLKTWHFSDKIFTRRKVIALFLPVGLYKHLEWHLDSSYRRILCLVVSAAHP